jgi:hypothetical protein
MGLVFTLFGAAMAFSRQLPRWLGWIAFVGGIGTVGQGMYVGHYGFEVGSPLIAIPTLVTFGWVLVAAIVLWLRSNGVEKVVALTEPEGDPDHRRPGLTNASRNATRMGYDGPSGFVPASRT